MIEAKDTQLAAQILAAALDKPQDAIYPTAHRLLKEAYPDQFVLETEESFFIPEKTSASWKITAYSSPEFESQFDYAYRPKKDRVITSLYSGWMQAEWSGHPFLLLAIGVKASFCREMRWFVVGESKEITETFFAEVCRSCSTVKHEVLVFSEGSAQPSRALYNSIQGASLEDLVLQDDLSRQIETDIQLFIEQAETYRKYRIPWKRGYILLGPPGNGKTHMIKALINRFKLPCLYVRSLTSQHLSPQRCVANAFARAREISPCLMVFEDLDTLLDETNRSFFLNELDGFASNDGIIAIASCNFPEKLDVAILDRPSRFDRKFHFELPELKERRQYFEVIMTRFDAELHLDEAGLDKASEATHGYSFAYLKELYVSSAVRWISLDRKQPILDIILEQADTLRDQMATAMQAAPGRPTANRRRRVIPAIGNDEDDD
ncbi:MAG: ATP-binding protein [Armatimonadetes bacterium]|nr:ATP-binding protein [Armatimonadota bacterium]